MSYLSLGQDLEVSDSNSDTLKFVTMGQVLTDTEATGTWKCWFFTLLWTVTLALFQSWQIENFMKKNLKNPFKINLKPPQVRIMIVYTAAQARHDCCTQVMLSCQHDISCIVHWDWRLPKYNYILYFNISTVLLCILLLVRYGGGRLCWSCIRKITFSESLFLTNLLNISTQIIST